MSTTIWRTRPVFITSTFRDMHAERDHLHNFVFPALKERLCERYHHLEPIDLRWGVETVGVDEQHAKEMLVLKVCLNEIERSRPFLIALLGDRYGWIPPKVRITQAALEAGYCHDLAGRSVTALEIEYGVLNSYDQQKRSFFYFRSPLPCHNMDAETAAIYSDQYSPNPEGTLAHQRLVEMKTRIEREHPGRVRHYQAEWDTEKDCVTGLEDWGRQVLEDLWNELDAETAALAQSAETSWEQQERWTLESFIEDRSRNFVGRQGLLYDLITLATSEAVIGANWGACITGLAGGGKSSLIAQLSKKLQNDNTILLTHSAGISPRSTQVENLLRRWVDELTQVIGIKNPLTDQTTAKELEKTFHEILGRGAAKKRVIILIDALNQFENSPQAKHLTWLPKRLPTNARLIATAIPCTASENLQSKQGVQRLHLPPLEQAEADHIIEAICKRYHRNLNPKVLQIMLDKKDINNQPSRGNPLWLILTLEELNLLDADDFARAEKKTGTGEENLLKMFIDTVEQIPGDVDELYCWLLNHAEKVHGREWTQAFVNLIAVSRSGWRESDLKVLMPNISNQLWNDLAFASLRRGFRGHVVQRGRHGQWDFSHAQMRIAVQKKNLTCCEEKYNLHTTIADYLLTLPNSDPLHECETMVHLISANDQARAAHYYSGEITNNEKDGATWALVEYLLAGEQKVDGPEVHWICGFSKIFEEDMERTLSLFNKYVSNLDEALEHLGKLKLRQAILENVANTLKKWMSTSTCPTQELMRLSFVATSKIGDIAFLLGNFDKSRMAYMQSQETIERLTYLIPDNSHYLFDLSNSFKNMGYIDGRHSPNTSRQWYLKAIEILEKLVHFEKENAQYLLGLSILYDYMGDTAKRQDPHEGRQWYLKGLDIRKRLAAKDNNNILYLRLLSHSFINMGDTDRWQDLSVARKWYLEGLEIAEKLIELERDNIHHQRELSISYDRIGDIDEQHYPEKGRQWYQLGLKIREKLVALDPDNMDFLHLLTISFERLGDMDGHLGAQKGSHWHMKCLKIRERLAALDPNDTQYLSDLSISYIKIGDTLRNNDPPKARQFYLKGLEIAKKQVELEPDNSDYLQSLSFSFDRIGDLNQHEEPQNCREWYLKGLNIREGLVKTSPHNTVYLYNLTISFDRMGDIDSREDLLNGRKWYIKGLNIRKRLVHSDPDNVDYLHWLSISYDKIGSIDGYWQQDPMKGRKWLLMGLKINKRLIAIQPDNIDYLRGISTTYGKLGDLDLYLNPEKSKQWHIKAFEIAERLVALDPDNVKYLQDVSMSYDKMGEIESLQDPHNARIWFEKSLKISKLLHTRNPASIAYSNDYIVCLYNLFIVSIACNDKESADTYKEECLFIINDIENLSGKYAKQIAAIKLELLS